jgi:hypothetical protein
MVSFTPGRFTPRKRAPGTHWIGGWVGPRAVLDAVVKRKIPSPRRESDPRTTIVQPAAQRYHGSYSSKVYLDITCYVGPCHHGMPLPRVADGGDGLQIRRVAANTLNMRSRTADKKWSSSFRVGREAKNSSS